MVGAIPHKLDNFFSQFKQYSYRKHETLLHPDDVPSGIYCIKKGYVRLFVTSISGEELTLLILGAGDFFPARWAITNDSIDYTVETMTPTELWKVSKDQFLEFIKNDPEVLHEFNKRMLLRLGGHHKRMEYLAFGNAYSKVASIIVMCAERFGKVDGKTVTIQLPLTHRDIASLVGMTRETTSLEIKKLEDKKIISHKKHVLVIHDMEKLKKESLLS